MATPTREEIRVAFEEFRDAVRALVDVCPERAHYYLRSAERNVSSWVQALRRSQHCAPTKPDSGPEPRQ